MRARRFLSACASSIAVFTATLAHGAVESRLISTGPCQFKAGGGAPSEERIVYDPLEIAPIQ